MLSSKIKSRFSLFLSQPGQLFLLVLCLICWTFILWDTKGWLFKLVLLTIMAYLCWLIFRKFNWKICFLILICFISLTLFQEQRFNAQPKVGNGEVFVIRPDQFNVIDQFGYGTATGSQKVSLSLTVNDDFDQLLNKQKPFLLQVKQSEQSLVKTAKNPAEFDLRNYSKRKGIKYQLEVKDYQVAPKNLTLLDWLSFMRAKIKQYFLSLPKNLQFFAGQLVLSENLDSSTREVVDNFRNLGVIHLLCISGLHVYLYTKIIDLVGTILRRTQNELLVVKAILLPILVFLGLAQAGLVRATLGFFISLFCNKSQIKISSIDQLSLVTLTHLIFFPSVFLGIGAQLSYLLVFGLRIIKTNNYWRKNLALNTLIAPVLIFNFYELNLLTVVNNFLIVPIFNFVILPFTMLGLLNSSICPVIAEICDSVLGLVNQVINGFGAKRFGVVVLGQINVLVCLLLIVLIVSFILVVQRDQKAGKTKRQTKERRRKKISIHQVSRLNTSQKILFSGLSIFFLNIAFIKFPLQGQVSFLDVGQGDSILLTTPIIRKTYLIDTGGKLSFGRKSTGKTNVEKITIPYLKQQGISHLDGVFLTHQDADHLGDLDQLLKHFPVRNIYFAEGMQNNRSFYKKVKNNLNQVRLVPVTAGQSLYFSDLNFQVLYPTFPSAGKNEDSLTMLVNIQNKSWFFSGDLDQAGEEKILALYPNLKFDYFKLGHHGSKTSSSQLFIENTQPKLGIISAGRNNRYGHPHPETLALLKSQNIASLNTAEYGMITWYYDPFGNQKFTSFLEVNRGNN